MDRRVKERLIGASILVAFVVLVVPELLSGPKRAAPPALRAAPTRPEPIRNVIVDLATAKAPATVDQPPSSAPQPASAAESPAAVPVAAPVAPPAAGGPAPTAATTPVETVSPSPISPARAAWAVQLGSFASKDNAEILLHQLKAQGFAAYMSAGGSGAAPRYRVRIGPLSDREAAERTAARLKSLGRVSSLVPPAA
jgi:DedD protein